MEDKEKRILEALEDMGERELFCLYNDYADANCYEKIFDMEEFNEILGNDEPIDIANMVYYGEFRANDNYFTFDGRGNIKTFDNLNDEIFLEEMAEYIARENEDFGWCDTITEILDEFEDKEG